MRSRQFRLGLSALASALLLAAGGAQAQTGAQCAYDRRAMLAMDEKTFDQTPHGFRSLAMKDCKREAADVLAAYRRAHPNSSYRIAWHEGQARAMLGQYAEAIALMRQTYLKDLPAAPEDLQVWNTYVDASIAFLERDRAALEKARATLAAIKPPAYMTSQAKPGEPIRGWPANLDVVDGLLHCFEHGYGEAYGSTACRALNKKSGTGTITAP